MLLLLLVLLIQFANPQSQRFRVTITNRSNQNLGIRLVKLSDHVVILSIAPNSPASNAPGSILAVGDAIIAIDNTPVPAKSSVRDVERLILQSKGLSIDLIILKGWQKDKIKKEPPPPTSNSKPIATPSPRSTRKPKNQPQQTWRYVITLQRTATTGFGLQLRAHKSNLILIDAIGKDSPAYHTHLIAPEDKIEAINGKYVYKKSLNDVINQLRKELKVSLIIISATSGGIRESYLSVKVNMKLRGFLGMKLKYSNHNSSVYVDKIFRSGIVGKDGQLREGDNFIAVMALDVVKSSLENKRMVVSKILKAFKNKTKDGLVPLRIKRLYHFNLRLQKSLEKKANAAFPQRRTLHNNNVRTTYTTHGNANIHQHQHPNKGTNNNEERRKKEIREMEQKRKNIRKPRFGEHYRVKIVKGDLGLGLRFKTQQMETTNKNGKNMRGSKSNLGSLDLIVTEVVQGSQAYRLGTVQVGDVLVSFAGYAMRKQKYPMRAMRQLASTSAKGTVVEMVFQCQGSTNSNKGNNKGNNNNNNNNKKHKKDKSNQDKFGRGSSENRNSKRTQIRRPVSITCEITNPDDLANHFGGKGSSRELICAPAKFGPPVTEDGLIGHVMMASPPNGCEPFNLIEDDRYKDAIVMIARGGCYFNHKVVHAQRAGAKAVVIINHQGENVLFSPDIDEKATTFQPEPVNIPLVMVLYTHATTILAYQKNKGFPGSKNKYSRPRFSLFGNYKNKQSSQKHRSIQDVPPTRIPFELMVRFGQGSFDLSMGTPGRVGNPRKKNMAVRITRRLPFAALYTGSVIKIPLERKKLCPICQGSGGIEGGLISCPHCGHTHAPGRHVVHDSLGPKCMQQHEKTCHICQGHGQVLRTPKHRCPHCNGHKVVSDNKILKVEIPPGIPNRGHRVLFARMGSEAPYRDPSDVEVNVEVLHHPIYTRRGSNLYINTYLNVLECLIGFNRTYVLPNNVTIELNRNQMSPPGTEFEFQGEGLPIMVDETKDYKKSRNNKRKKKETKTKTVPKMIEEHEKTKEEKEQEKYKKFGSFVVVVQLVKESLFDLNDSQRTMLRNALKTKTKENFEKETNEKEKKKKKKKKNSNGSNEKYQKMEVEKEIKERTLHDVNNDVDNNVNNNEQNGEEGEDVYVVHLREMSQLLSGMGRFWMPKVNKSRS